MKTWFTRADLSYAVTAQNARDIIVQCYRVFFITAGPVMLVSIVVNVLAAGAQTRFLFVTEPLKPKFSRMNPISGLKKLFSLKGVVELIKNLLKIAVLAAIMYNNIIENMGLIAKLFDTSASTAFVYTVSTVYSICMTIAGVFLGIGLADFLYQWWEYNKNIKMTKQEIKEEYKQMEGDPQIKGAIKQKQRQMAQMRMMQDVPKADVVVRNPTHIAVAIQYDAEKFRAPKVIAKGADLLAQRIVDVAEENKIPMTENKPLARALYSEVKLGAEIPATFYTEVAEILAWVYDIQGKEFPK